MPGLASRCHPTISPKNDSVNWLGVVRLLRNSRKTVAASSAPPEEPGSSLVVWRRASAPFALSLNPYLLRQAYKVREDSKGRSTRWQSRAFSSSVVSGLALAAGALVVYGVVTVHARYTFGLQSPIKVKLQSPLMVSRRAETPVVHQAQYDQLQSLSAYQQYACHKFGPACRVALAIQRAENPQGKCEAYHYNSDGTLDWGYFQINTIHLKRRGVNLRDLLDCRANIDFAYRLYLEQHGFSAWSTYRTGLYRRMLRE